MKTQTNVRNKKIHAKKNDTISDENSQISSVSFIPARPSSQPETKPGSSKQKATFFNLTDKELAIITSLSKGNSYKMIAGDCNITINTVREHIRNIYSLLL